MSMSPARLLRARTAGRRWCSAKLPPSRPRQVQCKPYTVSLVFGFSYTATISSLSFRLYVYPSMLERLSVNIEDAAARHEFGAHELVQVHVQAMLYSNDWID